MASCIFKLLRGVNLNTSISRHIHTSRIKKSDVKTSLGYFVPTSEQTKWVDTIIKDGRGQKFTVERNGFDLMKQVTSLTTDEFHNDKDKIYSTYYKEMEDALKEHLGAAHVQIYLIANVRKVDSIKIEEIEETSRGVFFCHSVSTTYFAPNIDKQYLKGRFLVLDVWRNISDTPVSKNAMAVLDINSVTYPEDYIFCDSNVGEYWDEKAKPHLRLLERNKEKHKWVYFSGMKKDEVLLVRQFDSENPDSKMCFHSAFEDPSAPEDAPARESCDVRAIAFFPTKEPWNI